MAFLGNAHKRIESPQFRFEWDLYTYLSKLYESRQKWAYFSVSKGGDGEGWKDTFFHVKDVDKAFEMIVKSNGRDVYGSTNIFSERKRVGESVSQLPALILDLDTYRVPKLQELHPKEVLEELEQHFFVSMKIPYPNGVIFSGGGLYLIWWLEFLPGTPKTLQKRKVVMRILHEMLKGYGSDPKSLDHAHVFRLPNTYNTKHGSLQEVKAYFNELAAYSISQFAESLPNLWEVFKREKHFKPDKQPRKSRGAVIKPIHKERTLSYDYMMDMFRLAKIRGGEMDGMREMAIFFIRNFYHWQHKARFENGDPLLFQESLEVAFEFNELLTNPLPEKEIRRQTLNKNKLYRFKVETRNEWFAISLDEQIQLKVKTNQAKRLKSKLQMRELRGSTSREIYLEQEKNKTDNKLFLLQEAMKKYPNAKGKELAKMLGVTPARITQLKKKLKN